LTAVVLQRINNHGGDYHYMIHPDDNIKDSPFILERVYLLKNPIYVKDENYFYPVLALEGLTYPNQYHFSSSILQIDKNNEYHLCLFLHRDDIFHLLSHHQQQKLKTFQSHQKEIVKMVNQILSGARYITLPKH